MRKNNLIIIKNETLEDVQKAIILYKSSRKLDIEFELYEDNNIKLIYPPLEYSFDDYCDMVNYLSYSFGDKKAEVGAYCKPVTKTDWANDLILDKNVHLFVEENDIDYDNVSGIAEDNFCFKIDFGAGKGFKQLNYFKKFIPPKITPGVKKIKFDQTAGDDLKRQIKSETLKKTIVEYTIGIIFGLIVLGIIYLIDSIL